MKRILIACTIAASLYCTPVFAKGIIVSHVVLDAFKSNFSSATNVSWEMVGTYYRASFNEDDEAIFAYFGDDGSLVATSKFISINDLPKSLKKGLKKYSGTSVIEVFEVDSKDDIRYYVTLGDGKKKVILESAASAWNVFNKEKKF
ncbi:MAG: hypothetical protein ACM3VS_18475 [Candidatus Dadabacteria bacterium]